MKKIYGVIFCGILAVILIMTGCASGTSSITSTITTTATATTTTTTTATITVPPVTKTVSGIVIGGGDTTPSGLLDAPRRFVYRIQQDNEATINVGYTAYPPSPAGDTANRKIFLSFCGGSIQTGDYLSAQGAYDGGTNTVTAMNEGDYIVNMLTDAGAQQLATDFMENDNVTFNFDSIPGSLKFIKTDPGWTSSFRSTAFTFTYQTAHPGHGDRSGQMLAQVITDHTAVVLVNIEKGTVASANCDRTWNMLTNEDLPVSISGFVISGGDTAPADGPLDVPHKFVYQVRQSNGETVNVSYTAYPPSPVGDAQRKQIVLEFYAGTINIGDQIRASGKIDKSTNTIAADYIRTAVPRIEVTGLIIGGGDTQTEGGPQDAPHHFIYQVQTENGVVYNVDYTVYPSSPAGDAAMAKITLTYWNGIPVKGDYMKAYGLYDVTTETIKIAGEGDFIKTYPAKP
jgi:hypothetical protein